LAVRSSFVSGEIRPGDWANVNASAIAPTNHNQRRERGTVEHETGAVGDPLRPASPRLRSP
jgi:hypothetical protein